MKLVSQPRFDNFKVRTVSMIYKFKGARQAGYQFNTSQTQTNMQGKQPYTGRAAVKDTFVNFLHVSRSSKRTQQFIWSLINGSGERIRTSRSLHLSAEDALRAIRRVLPSQFLRSFELILYQERTVCLVQNRCVLAGTTALFTTVCAASAGFAQGFCDSVTGTGLNLGCAETIGNRFFGSPLPVSNLTDVVIGSFDGLTFDSDSFGLYPINGFWTKGDIKFSNSNYYGSWENVYLGSTRTDGAKTSLDAFARPADSILASNLAATLLFDRLTLENTSFELRDGATLDGLQTGQIQYLGLGYGASGFGRGGGLTLRNSDLILRNGTQLLMNSPDGGPAFIRAETGTNELRLGSNHVIGVPLHVDVSDGARLDLVGTEIEPFFDSWLTLGQGSELRLSSNSVLGLTKSNGSSTQSSTINGGTLRLEGSGTELQLTDPRITDGSVIIDTSAIFRVQGSTNEASTLTFAGNSDLRFESGAAALTGSVTGPNKLDVRVLAGTTTVSSAVQMDVGAGLRARNIEVNQGTLDTSPLIAQSDFYTNVFGLAVANGGVFVDGTTKSYAELDELQINGGTLRSRSSFGQFGGMNGSLRAVLNDATLDLIDSSQSSGVISSGLSSVQINANQLLLSGDNKVHIGISPLGECVVLGGSCIPGSTRYAGELLTNVGETSANSGIGTSPTLSGFDTVLFVPMATNANASSADYISGGENGVYTVARHNFSPDLTGNSAAYDASPRTPTVSELIAAGSDLPANLIYSIVNDPVADNQVDIAFVDVGLTNHPAVVGGYTPQSTTSVVTHPTTGNHITTSVVITPTGNGATQTVTTTTAAPGGGVISTNTATNTLGPATGTTNTGNYGQLLTNSGNTLTHVSLQQVSTLHPEAYASSMTVALEHSDLRRNMILSNIQGHAAGGGRIEGATEDGRRVWFDAGLRKGNVDSVGGLAGFDYVLNQFILGSDLSLDSHGRFGAYAGYGTYSMSEHTASADTLDFSSDIFSIGVYGAMDTENWSLKGMAGFSKGSTDAARDAILGAAANRHNATYDHNTFEAAVRAEYTSLPSQGGWHFAPEVGLGYARYKQDGFTEDGDPATALTLESTSAESLIGGLGLNVTGPSFAGGLIPVGFVRYEHDFIASSDDTHDVTAAFATSPNVTQTFVGTHRGANAISVGLGLEAAINSSVEASAGVIFQRNSNGDEFGGGFGITWRF